VPPLGEGAETVDVEVSADALRARGQPGAEATPSPVPTGTIPYTGSIRPTPRSRPTREPAAPVTATPTPLSAPVTNSTTP
jgi:cytoskeleton protein RodZ